MRDRLSGGQEAFGRTGRARGQLRQDRPEDGGPALAHRQPPATRQGVHDGGEPLEGPVPQRGAGSRGACGGPPPGRDHDGRAVLGHRPGLHARRRADCPAVRQARAVVEPLPVLPVRARGAASDGRGVGAVADRGAGLPVGPAPQAPARADDAGRAARGLPRRGVDGGLAAGARGGGHKGGRQRTSRARPTCWAVWGRARRSPSWRRSGTPTAGRGRSDLCRRAAGGAGAPALRSDELWQAPPLAGAFDDELRCRLLAALDEVPSFVDELEATPLGTAHGDACPNNLLRTRGSDDVTLIDYGFWSRQVLGFDLGQLLVGDVQIGRRAAATLPETEAACVPAYVAGIRRRGCRRRRATVARAHALHLMIFIGCPHRCWIRRVRTPFRRPTRTRRSSAPRSPASPWTSSRRRRGDRPPGLDSLHVSTLRESFERASLPALTFLSGLPRAVPFLAILGLVVLGLFVPWGWVLIALVVLVLTWIAAAGMAPADDRRAADARRRHRPHGRHRHHPGGAAHLSAVDNDSHHE